MSHRCCPGRGCGDCSYCFGDCDQCNGLNNPDETGYSLIIKDANGININYFKKYSRALSELNKYYDTESKNADEILGHIFHHNNEYLDEPKATYLLTKIEYEN